MGLASFFEHEDPALNDFWHILDYCWGVPNADAEYPDPDPLEGPDNGDGDDESDVFDTSPGSGAAVDESQPLEHDSQVMVESHQDSQMVDPPTDIPAEVPSPEQPDSKLDTTPKPSEPVASAGARVDSSVGTSAADRIRALKPGCPKVKCIVVKKVL